jgi:hypothetical protein
MSKSISTISAALLLGASSLAAQVPRTQFVVTKGKDTVAVEVFTRDGRSMTSEIVQSNGVRTQFTVELRADSTIQTIEYQRQNRQGQGLSLDGRFADSLVSATVTSGSDSEKLSIERPGKATPFLAVSFALSERLIRAVHLGVGDSTKVLAIRLGALDTATVTLSRFHTDSVRLAMRDLDLKVALSPKGEVVGAVHMAQNWVVARKTVR